MFIIRREGHPQYERAVKITRHEDGRFWWVNPRSQVMRATGCGVNRQWCIQSFAQGLKDAGHKVMIDEQREGFLPYKREFTGTPVISCVYWLLGFAWGQGKWEDFVIALQRDVRQGRWFDALEATGRYFLKNRYQELRVILPPLS